MNIYDYEYNDIIKAQNIINSVRTICDKKAELEEKDNIEFVIYNNMSRNCTSTWLLLDYYRDKIRELQKLQNVRDDILNTLINDYHIHKYFDTSSENKPCTLNFVFENENYTLKIDKNYITFFDTHKSEKILITESIRIFTEGDFIDKQEKAIKKIADILLKPVC